MSCCARLVRCLGGARAWQHPCGSGVFPSTSGDDEKEKEEEEEEEVIVEGGGGGGEEEEEGDDEEEKEEQEEDMAALFCLFSVAPFRSLKVSQRSRWDSKLGSRVTPETSMERQVRHRV